MNRVRYDFHIALPFILMAASGALNAVLPAISSYHPSTQAGILTVALAGVLGDWLRVQIAQWKQGDAPATPDVHAIPGGVTHVAPAVALPALPVVDNALLVALVERTLRDALATPPPVPPPLPASGRPHPEPPTPGDRPSIGKVPRTPK